ncbi:MAG TPA: hypothetical protein VEP90_15770 [Methylomirabilota bacterium]|nr:hypothetical protein [Methylomirabilota bacterium]
MHYVAYHIDDEEKSVPIATGIDKAETLGLAAQRVLMMGITWGDIGVREQNNLLPHEFEKLTEILNEYFTKKIRT